MKSKKGGTGKLLLVGGAVLTSLGFFWQACEDLLKQCRLFCLSGLHSGDFAIQGGGFAI